MLLQTWLSVLRVGTISFSTDRAMKKNYEELLQKNLLI